MKKLLVIAATLISLEASSAFAKTEGSYVGADFMQTTLKYYQKYTQSGMPNALTDKPGAEGHGYGIGLSYKRAFNFNDIFIAPGVILEANNTKVDRNTMQRLQVLGRYGVKTDIGYDLTKTMSPYLTFGYAAISYRSRENSTSANTSIKNGVDSGWFYGFGAKFDQTENVAFNIDYTTQNFIAKTRTDGGSNYVSVLKSHINVIKFGVLYKF